MPLSPDETLNTTPLIHHLIELRRRVMICTVALMVATGVSYLFADQIYALLVHPLAESMGNEPGRRLIYTGLTEAFFTYLKVALFSGVVLAFPVIAHQLYGFAAPGLYKNEKHIFLPFLIASPLLFFAGAWLAYSFVFPMAWKFFLSFETTGMSGELPIQLEARVSEYLSLVIQLMLAFGLAFQMPVLLALLARAGLITGDWLAARRKYAIVGIVIMAAILTPPDVITQIALAIPLWLLYECSIILCRQMARQAESSTTSSSQQPSDDTSHHHA